MFSQLLCSESVQQMSPILHRHLVESKLYNISKILPGSDHSATLKVVSDTMQPALESTRAGLLLPVGRADGRHLGGWLSLNARRVVSCSPTPRYCLGNTMFISVCHWAEAGSRVASYNVLSLSLSALSVLPHFTFLNPLLFFFTTPLCLSTCELAH